MPEMPAVVVLDDFPDALPTPTPVLEGTRRPDACPDRAGQTTRPVDAFRDQQSGTGALRVH